MFPSPISQLLNPSFAVNTYFVPSPVSSWLVSSGMLRTCNDNALIQPPFALTSAAHSPLLLAITHRCLLAQLWNTADKDELHRVWGSSSLKRNINECESNFITTAHCMSCTELLTLHHPPDHIAAGSLTWVFLLSTHKTKTTPCKQEKQV